MYVWRLDGGMIGYVLTTRGKFDLILETKMVTKGTNLWKINARIFLEQIP